MATGGRLESCSTRSMPVAKMAPRVICPSMPIFHSPAEKVIRTPAVVSSSGDQVIRIATILRVDPNAPWKTLAKAFSGGAPAASRMKVVMSRASSNAPT